MTNAELVRNVLHGWSDPRVSGEWLVVPTACTYPSRKTVNIYLSGGRESVRAFDGGGAFDELDGSGEYDFDAFKILRSFAKKTGLAVDSRGWLASEPVSYDDLPGVVPYLANSSVRASQVLRSRRRKKRHVDLRDEVNAVLLERFDREGIRRDGHLVGASNKSHRFDFLVHATASSQLAIDAALPDSSSINAIVVRQLDVRLAEPLGVSQLIVYDDRDRWKSEDIAILRSGANPLAFTRLPRALARMVAS